MKRLKKILILIVPVAMAALHYFFLSPFLFELGNKTADKYACVIWIGIFVAHVLAIAAAMED